MTEVEPKRPSANSQALIRLLPRVGGVLATWRVERHQERLEVFLDSFGEVPEDTVIEAIKQRPYFADDLDRAARAAAETHSEEKIRLLGKVLRAELVAKDQAAVDNVQQILRVAIELDPVDIRALVAIRESPKSDPFDTVRDYLSVNSATAFAIRSRMVRLGLIEMFTEAAIASPEDKDDDSVFVEQSWSTTPVFEALVLMLM